jgi:undecaprenyl-diphosphatase
VGLLEALRQADETLLHAARGWPPWALPIFFLLTVTGDRIAVVLLLPLLFHPKARGPVVRLLGALIVTSAVVSLMKLAVGRPRPCVSLEWCNAILIPTPRDFSFPSGHAAGSFAFAGFMSRRMSPWGWIAMTYAALVAWSRCVLGVHYPSDVVLGAMLGATIGAIFAGKSTSNP